MPFSLPQAGLRAATFTLIFATGLAAQVPLPGKGSSHPRPGEGHEPREGRAEILPVFEFHSGFWVNLHHFLYQQARIREKLPVRRTDQGTTATEMAPAAALTPNEPAEAGAWSASLDYYAATLAGRDLLFDGDLVAIKNILAQSDSFPRSLGAQPSLEASGLPPKFVAALEQAAPIYRAHWWPEHDRTNRSWIAAVAPMVRQLGGTLAEQLAAIYQGEWPAGRIRVDLTIYAGRVGGYTSLDPLHVTISSTEPRNQGSAALEVLFHEASHGLAGAVREGIARECRAHNKPIPRDLWHALLFYTTGEIVRRALSVSDASSASRMPSREATAGRALGVSDASSTSGTPSRDAPAGRRLGSAQSRVEGDYTPYAYRYGLYARGWQNYQRLLERYWQPYLDGKEDFGSALAHLVAAL